MALELKIENSINVTGKSLYVEDITGLYAVPQNEGGWGDPNLYRRDVALMGIVTKFVTDSESLLLSPVNDQIDYDASYTNDYQSVFEFTIGDDGGYEHYMLMFLPSDDGNVYLNGDPIYAGNYFYYVPDGEIYQKEANNTITLIQDYSVLIDPDNGNAPQQVSERRFWTPQLQIKQADLYNEYRKARGNCDNENEILDKITECDANIEQAMGIFYRGYYMEAQEIIDRMLTLCEIEKYQP